MAQQAEDNNREMVSAGPKKEEVPEFHHLEKGEDGLTMVASDGGHTGARKTANPAEVKLKRKLDFLILPVLWVMYWFK